MDDEQTAGTSALWSLGDYPVLAALLEPAAHGLVTALGVAAGERVLDVAAGTGNLAVAAARRGATVQASDLTPRMVELGRARTAAEGLDVAWAVGPAEDLDAADGAADVVASAFGLIFSSEPEQAVAEAARVLRPGGRLGLTAWGRTGFVHDSSRALAAWLPREPGQESPTDRWSAEDQIRALLDPHFHQISVTVVPMPWIFASAGEAVATLRESSPVHVMVAAALGERADAAFAELVTLAERYADGTVVSLPADHLRITARRR